MKIQQESGDAAEPERARDQVTVVGGEHHPHGLHGLGVPDQERCGKREGRASKRPNPGATDSYRADGHG